MLIIVLILILLLTGLTAFILPLLKTSAMGKVILAAVVTLICGYLGTVIGNEILNSFRELGCITAVAVMGAFIIFFDDSKKTAD